MSPTQQRMDALERANGVRTARKELKQALACGKEDARRLLENPPEFIATMKVGDLLMAVPGVGKTKRNKILRYALQGKDLPIDHLSATRRAAVAKCLA